MILIDYSWDDLINDLTPPPGHSLTKDVDKRPNYMPLREHPMIEEYEGRDDVDVGLWLKSVNKKTKA